MTGYVIRRAAQTVPLLVLISMVLFGVLHLIPGGPEQVAFSPHLSPQARHALVVELGLDQPLPVQYARWLWGVARLDFGATYSDGQPVIAAITDRVPATVELLGTAFLVALLLTIPLGILTAVKQYSFVDYAVTLVAYLGISMPLFWLSEMAILLLAIHFGLFPVGGVQTEGAPPSLPDHLRHLILPAAVLSLYFIAAWSRYLRASMIDVLQRDYLRTARAKGMSTLRVVATHALRNALIPLVTVVALDVGSIFGGAVVTETIFTWPGLGRLFLDALSARDYPVLMAMLALSALTIVLCNLAADIVYALLDPRIRYA